MTRDGMNQNTFFFRHFVIYAPMASRLRRHAAGEGRRP
jgi:hypothetical protein